MTADLPLRTVQFIVPGEPRVKQRPRTGKSSTGKTVVYSDAKMIAAEREIATWFRQQAGPWQPRLDMCRLDILAVVGNRRWRDRDNIEKLVLDALNGVAYVDDHQVTDGRTRVEYGRGNPHTLVTISFTGRTTWP